MELIDFCKHTAEKSLNYELQAIIFPDKIVKFNPTRFKYLRRIDGFWEFESE